MSERLDPERLDKTLRSFLAILDYDLHKSWECDEEDGKDYYSILVRDFIRAWEASE